MALINCPECNKEISDQGDKCPNCGYPIKRKAHNKSNIKKMYMILPILLIIVICIIVSSIYYFKTLQPRNTYTEAMSLLNVGKYDEANTLLDSISDYSDVEQIQKELKYESYAYSCINILKKILKNPDSYVAYEINFYENWDNNKENIYPSCVMNYGAENGFGGNTTGYALFLYKTDTKGYSLIGTCDSLKESDYSAKDLNDIAELAICKIINAYIKDDKSVGKINMERIKAVLKNDSYSTIKIIE